MGQKNALISRIQDVRAEKRGKCPVDQADGEDIECARKTRKKNSYKRLKAAVSVIINLT